MRARVKSGFRAILIDRDTGRRRVHKSRNAMTADGLNYVARAVAGDPGFDLVSTNSNLNCAVGSDFASTSGPLVDGDSHYRRPNPSTVLLGWVDDSSNTYALDTVDLLTGATTLANTDFPDNTEDKQSNDLLIIEWAMTISDGTGIETGGGGAMTAKAGGGTDAWDAEVTLFNSGTADADHGSISVAGAVLTFDEISYHNQTTGIQQPTPEDLADLTVNGLILALGSVTVMQWLPRNVHVPEPNPPPPAATPQNPDPEVPPPITWAATITFA